MMMNSLYAIRVDSFGYIHRSSGDDLSIGDLHTARFFSSAHYAFWAMKAKRQKFPDHIYSVVRFIEVEGDLKE